MAELKGRAALQRQQRKKRTQPQHILLQCWRQLKQQWSPALSQCSGDFVQLRHQVTCIFKSLQVRDLSRCLEHELETGGNRVCPSSKHRSLGHAIKCVVDLDSTKTLAVKAEHLLDWQILGIERAFPLLVRITTGAGV